VVDFESWQGSERDHMRCLYCGREIHLVLEKWLDDSEIPEWCPNHVFGGQHKPDSFESAEQLTLEPVHE
jgi:hypothetical protein